MKRGWHVLDVNQCTPSVARFLSLLKVLMVLCPVAAICGEFESDFDFDSLSLIDGSVLFVSSTSEGLPEPAICAVNLETSEVEFILFQDPLAAPVPVGTPPIWGADRTEVFFLGVVGQDRQGILRLERAGKHVALLFPAGKYLLSPASNSGSGSAPIDRKKPTKINPDSLIVEIYIQGMCYGRQSQCVYLLVEYWIRSDLTLRDRNVLSSVVPGWLTDRVDAKLQASDHRWTDLVEIKAHRESTLITEVYRRANNSLVVSPDERFFAFDDRHSIVVYDRTADSFLTFAPPEGVTIGEMSFSPKAQLLTVVTMIPNQKSGVMAIRTPEFDTTFPLLVNQPIGIGSAIWIQDDRFLLLNRSLAYFPGYTELFIWDRITGKRKLVSRPYKVNGKEDARIHINTGIDWIHE